MLWINIQAFVTKSDQDTKRKSFWENYDNDNEEVMVIDEEIDKMLMPSNL